MSRLLNFTFKETNGFSRQSEPAQLSVRLARGVLDASAARHIVEEKSGRQVQDAYTEILSLWPDGSVDWLKIELGVSIAAHGEVEFALAFDDEQEGTQRKRLGNSASNEIATILASPVVTNGNLNIGIGPFEKQYHAALSFYCIDQNGSQHVCKIDSLIETRKTCKTSKKINGTHAQNCLHRTLRIQIDTSCIDHTRPPTMEAILDLYPATGLVELELCVHNPAAAKHAKGLWDLGDPASFFFKEIGVSISHPDGRDLKLVLDSDIGPAQFEAADSLAITQLSSGGANSTSTSHLDKDGIRPEKTTGFEISCDGRTVANGARTSPSVSVVLPTGTLTTHLLRFWQEFPSALRLKTESTSVVLFADNKRIHELQPGERKRRCMSMHFAANESHTEWLSCRLTPPHIHDSRTVASEHFERASVLTNDVESKLFSLIESPDSFYDKREVVDEYGWRNFGDVYADHETLYQSPTSPTLISHYNNQYDQILGFGLQFLRTRDARWFDLMNDLARHVTDIDMYHTSEDRIEYNNGLFWHTNHYEDAATATHRCFSISNYDPANPIGLSGGPGPEQCYTSGLALHYFLTGDKQSKQAVVELTRWIQQYFHGDDTLIGRLHSIARHELSAIAKQLRGRVAPPYRYPLTRGTGNLLVALLDAFYVTGDRGWIDKAECVLFCTFHPEDDPVKRDLENIEHTWSHIVFLQAVLRFIATKDSLGEFDMAREHARRGFLTYAQYTLMRGTPYLDKPERLEFVNDTWAAQDIRRFNVMSGAAYHDPSQADAYMDKATHFGHHICNRLNKSDETRFARIQAIIMQNVGSASWFEQQAQSGDLAAGEAPMTLPPAPTSCISSEIRSSASKITSGLKHFSASRELRRLRFLIRE